MWHRREGQGQGNGMLRELLGDRERLEESRRVERRHGEVSRGEEKGGGNDKEGDIGDLLTAGCYKGLD